MRNKYWFFALIFVAFSFTFQQKSYAQKQWWLHSSFEGIPANDTLKSELLFHTEGKYSFSLSNGITNGNVHVGDLLIVERKNRFSHFTFFNFNDQNVTVKNTTTSSYKQVVYDLVDYIDYDISKTFFIQAGAIWEKNDAALIKNRYAFYLGLGANNSLLKKLHIKSLVALGRVNQQYTISVADYNVIKGPYTLFYFGQKYTCPINNTLLINGELAYFQDINELDRYRFRINLSLKAMLAKHIAIVVGYTHKYDNEQVLLNLVPNNSIFTTGIQLSL